jgi:hypothetical protein
MTQLGLLELVRATAEEGAVALNKPRSGSGTTRHTPFEIGKSDPDAVEDILFL